MRLCRAYCITNKSKPQFVYQKSYHMIYSQLRAVKVSMPQFEISNWIARNRNFNLGQNVVAPILNWGRSQFGAQQYNPEINFQWLLSQ